jgi:sigma-B regulation protein RsbU (phosphoserine phosphatase)
MFKISKVLFWVGVVLVFILSVGIIFIVYPDTHPLGAIRITVPREEIINRSAEILADWNIESGVFKIRMDSRQKRDLTRAVYKQYGLAEGNRILREKIPSFFQEVVWVNRDHKAIHNLGVIDRINFNFSGEGDLLYFNLEISDSVDLAPVSLEDARVQAQLFFDRYYSGKQGVLEFDQFSKLEQYARTDYQFTWKGKISDPQIDLSLKIKISGDKVSFYELNFQLPVPMQRDTSDIIGTILEVCIYIFFVIFTLLVAYKRSRNYEISFRYALYAALVLTLFFLPELIFNLFEDDIWQLIIGISVSVIFLGLVLFISWAVGESVSREVWNDKFYELDLYSHGYLLNSRQGYAILRGIWFGVITFAVISMLFWITQKMITFNTSLEGDSLEYLSSKAPVFSLMAYGMRKSLFIFTSVFLLLTALIYQKTDNRFISAFICAFPLAVLLGGSINPLYIGLPLAWLAFTILIWVFIRFTALSGFIALLTFVCFEFGLIFFYSEALPWILFIAFFILLGSYALIAISTPDSAVDADSLSPELVAYINERKRLKQELEIAREVQMSFLPQTSPVIEGLDIASDCRPASEVGGDYYDFILLEEECLGIALGDVSGKGTQAAFYMTLTKGFLRALTRISLSPALILNEMNQLFYENTRRNAFISMIYAVFNMNSKKVILARSGHDPVIHYHADKQQASLITSKGIALGLDKGKVFGEIIEEVTITLLKDDTFIFYTDGFTEAMNKSQEQYGQERLMQIVTKQAGRSANDLMRIIFEDVDLFCAKEKKHDDMTIVIVKIK